MSIFFFLPCVYFFPSSLFSCLRLEGALSVSVDRGMGKWLQVVNYLQIRINYTIYFDTQRLQVTVMGHRHLYNTSPLFEGEPDQNWSHMHTDQHYVHLGRTSTSENGSFIYPAENMSIDSISFPSHWNSSTRSNGYASSSHNIDVPPHQSDASGSSSDHFVHSSSAGAFFAVSENYVHQPSSSNYDRQTFHVDGGFIDLTMGSGQGPHKRKSPGIPPVYERGSTSRYFNAGSSTDLPTSSELWQEKPNIDSQYMPWDHFTMTPTFRGTGLSIRGEGSLRNVRSRSALDLDSNQARTHLSSNHSHNSYPTVPPVDHSSMVDLSGQTSATLTRDWSQMNMSPANGRVLLSDTSTFGLETSHFLVGTGATASNASVDVGGFHHEFGTSRNPTPPQSFQNNQTQTARGIRSNYSQRSTPTFRASSSLRLGHVTSLDDGLPMVAESYSSRHPRPLSTIGWRNGDRNGRSRISSERYRSLTEESGLHDRFSSEGFMVVERASLYGSRNMLDQHRDMRMDIDNMSYEELLALGERIGYVNTGVSDDLFSKCLTETIYCSSEQSQDEGNCVICLEEYKNMDDVGTLKTCGHDYHVSCVKKWLSMKKLCPICKASALPEDTEDK
ncbi:E3 ubiquitin-protein ligase MBR2 [Spatholobus suberectus]|nr:E3 ubiquitin-protein ligase MBR2 [Spatholobus suberectus]